MWNPHNKYLPFSLIHFLCVSVYFMNTQKKLPKVENGISFRFHLVITYLSIIATTQDVVLQPVGCDMFVKVLVLLLLLFHTKYYNGYLPKKLNTF